MLPFEGRPAAPRMAPSIREQLLQALVARLESVAAE
jgi:hypothetical protein